MSDPDRELVEDRASELVERAQAAALERLREEIDGETYLSPVDSRALREACIRLSRTYPRAMEVAREMDVAGDALLARLPERTN